MAKHRSKKLESNETRKTPRATMRIDFTKAKPTVTRLTTQVRNHIIVDASVNALCSADLFVTTIEDQRSIANKLEREEKVT